MFLLAFLVILSLLTSSLTAVTGIGGGIILIAFMPLILPASAIIPIHAVTQCASNLSRAWFGRRQILIPPLRQYLLGNLAAVLVGGWLIQRLTLTHIPLFIGGYILLNLWLPAFQRSIARVEHFALIGFIQTVLSMFVGIAGAMNLPLLMKRYDDYNAIVSTAAAMMVFNHFAKVIVFTWAGFAWTDYGWLLVALVIAVSLGSWLGVYLRQRINAAFLRPVLKILLTLLALHMMGSHLYSLL